MKGYELHFAVRNLNVWLFGKDSSNRYTAQTHDEYVELLRHLRTIAFPHVVCEAVLCGPGRVRDKLFLLHNAGYQRAEVAKAMKNNKLPGEAITALLCKYYM